MAGRRVKANDGTQFPRTGGTVFSGLTRHAPAGLDTGESSSVCYSPPAARPGRWGSPEAYEAATEAATEAARAPVRTRDGSLVRPAPRGSCAAGDQSGERRDYLGHSDEDLITCRLEPSPADAVAAIDEPCPAKVGTDTGNDPACFPRHRTPIGERAAAAVRPIEGAHESLLQAQSRPPLHMQPCRTALPTLRSR